MVKIKLVHNACCYGQYHMLPIVIDSGYEITAVAPELSIFHKAGLQKTVTFYWKEIETSNERVQIYKRLFTFYIIFVK